MYAWVTSLCRRMHSIEETMTGISGDRFCSFSHMGSLGSGTVVPFTQQCSHSWIDASCWKSMQCDISPQVSHHAVVNVAISAWLQSRVRSAQGTLHVKYSNVWCTSTALQKKKSRCLFKTWITSYISLHRSVEGPLIDRNKKVPCDPRCCVSALMRILVIHSFRFWISTAAKQMSLR